MTAAGPPLLVVVGPTATGKTELAVELSERHGGEIVSADSVQIYREFVVGTGKPSAEERARVAHHLIDVVDPLEPVDAARFAELAERAIEDIRARGKRPIVCGGTFLWVRALVYGLAPAPPADPAVRARHRALVEAEGRPALHAALAAVDAVAATRLAPNDFVRVSRALEVFELTGAPLTSFHEQHGFRTPRYQARRLGVKRAPAELDERIARRVRGMLAAGWVDEVRSLLAAGYGSARAMGSVGYKQIHEALRAETSLDDDILYDPIRRATRVFARRQRTWLRDENVEWLEPGTLPRLEDA
jgi:tRNA dimethylallyltransferase